MSREPLWDYAVRVYADEHVAGALLRLQDRRGVDVDLLLWCCWCAATGRGVPEDAELRAADHAVADWREQVTRGLRAVRDAIGTAGSLAALPGAAEVRERVLQTELDAERVALGVLEGLAPAAAGGGGEPRLAAATGLAGLCRVQGFTPDAGDEADLLTLLEAAFRTRVDAALRAALRAAPR